MLQGETLTHNKSMCRMLPGETLTYSKATIDNMKTKFEEMLNHEEIITYDCKIMIMMKKRLFIPKMIMMQMTKFLAKMKVKITMKVTITKVSTKLKAVRNP